MLTDKQIEHLNDSPLGLCEDCGEYRLLGNNFSGIKICKDCEERVAKEEDEFEIEKIISRRGKDFVIRALDRK